MHLADAACLFDGAGRLVDPATRRALAELLDSFAGWIQLHAPAERMRFSR
jgi:hypothetical protein